MSHRSEYDVCVDSEHAGAEGARVDGILTYSRVARALNDAPSNSIKPFVIYIKNGRYHEKLTIDKPFITLNGQDQERTILTFDDAADTKKPDGTTYGTFGSASVAILASDVRVENLTIENAFDYPANAAKARNDPTRLANAQAVALKTDLANNRAIFKNITLVGYQDTLYVNAGHNYFHQCHITGHIDFIFGAGQAVFDDCDIVSRDSGSAVDNGYITAASTLISQSYGFLFSNCRLKKGSPELADHTVALGRPWHPTTLWPDGTRAANPQAVGCVVFKQCWMDSHISAAGWERMHGWDKNGNEIWFYPQDARFFESGSTGPGATSHAMRRVLLESESQAYTIDMVLGGWNPSPADLRY
jgi:pectinesterase